MADNQSNPNSTNETGENPRKNLSATNGDAVSKAGLWQYLAELVLAGAVGTGVWLFGEHLVSHGHTFLGSVINFVAFCIYFATVPITTVKVWPHPKSVWLSFCVFCALMALVFTFFSKPSIEPQPHFTISLRVGDSPAATIILTNEYLFRSGMVNLIHSTNNLVLFYGISGGCIVIPTQTKESNKVFNIIAENDSSVKVADIGVIVGFSKDWKIELDSTKWHSVTEHLMIPGYRLEVTNIQYWAAQSPWPLFPSDSITFPAITNFSIPEFNNPTNKNGILEIIVRSADLEGLISANVLFIRTPSSVFKPFVTSMGKGTDGVWRVSLSKKELEDSQK